MALFKEKAVGKEHLIIPGTPEPAPANDKLMIVDADTIVYSVACVYEYPEELLPTAEAPTDEPNYDPTTHSVWRIDLDKAMVAVMGKVDRLLELTGCKDFELHFTSGKNFRYEVDPGYKSNRKATRYPAGLRELKALALAEYEGKATIHSEIEADDYVVWKKAKLGDKAVLTAVDKDVLQGVAGTHLNYYESVKWSKPMKWVETTEEDAFRFPYLQCLMGDAADGIEGIKGIGPAKAKKTLAGLETKEELWNEVLEIYSAKGKSRQEALTTMRLVSMTQLDEEGNLNLWEPEGDENE